MSTTMERTGDMDGTDRSGVLRRALVELKAARAEAADARRLLTDPVAVVGLGCRFPGGDGVEGFWELLVSGGSGVTEVPADRWDLAEFFSPDVDVPGRMVSRRGGFVDGVREFDAGLFGVPPREVVGVDPQHRLVLEVAWEALECAGVAPDSLRGSRTGVFVGMGGSDFERLNLSIGDVSVVDGYSAVGGAGNMAANRLSYVLGLEGPSMVVDSACSSSLVAVHLACQALRSGECDLAIVAGVNTLLSPGTSVALSKARMLSPDGECKTFDADADGYVRGEGCGVVVLRRLSAARDEGRRVWAVLKGSAVNQDGRSSGLTVPQGSAQQEVIRQALRAASVKPAEVGYVETHGTGTALGDPIEVRALASVLSVDREMDNPVRLGAVKANIGHLEAAAGIAGLIKAVLVVDRGVVPPNVNVRKLTPFVPWEVLPVRVPLERAEWTARRRVAGVSSFGFGGTNAHVVLESAPDEPARTESAGTWPVLVKVAGRGADAMRDGAAALVSWLETNPDADPHAVAWMADTGRADLSDRAAIVAGSAAALATGLHAIADRVTADGVVTGRRAGGGAPLVAFVVPGHTSPESFDLAVELGRWWQSIGVVPDMVLAQGTGVAAAAVLTGALSRDEAAATIGSGADADLGAATVDVVTDADQSIEDAARELVAAGAGLVIQLGPGDVLALLADHGVTCVESTGTGRAELLTAAARVWTLGADLDWAALLGERPARLPVLPTYPFQHRTYWPEHAYPRATAPRAATDDGIGLRPRITRTATGDIIGETRISLRQVPFLAEHRVHGRLVVPGVLFLELVLRTAADLFPGPATAQDLAVSRSLVLDDDDTATVQVVIGRPVGGRAKARVFSRVGESEWHEHFETTLYADSRVEAPAGAVDAGAFTSARRRGGRILTTADFYRDAWHPDFRLGSSFTLVRSARRVPGAAVGKVGQPPAGALGVTAGIRPELLLLDACIQLIAVAALAEGGFEGQPVHLGTGYERMRVDPTGGYSELDCVAVLRDTGDGSIFGDLRLFAPDGTVVAEVWGAGFRPVTRQLLSRMVTHTDAGPARPSFDVERLGSVPAGERRRLVLDHLVRELAVILGSAPEAVEPDVPVVDVADSLMISELRTDIEQDLAVTVPMEVMFDGATLTRLADWVVNELPVPPAEETPMPEARPTANRPAVHTAPTKKKRVKDMSVERMTELARLDPDIAAHGDPEPIGTAPSATLLTGATGFVGAFLLTALLDRRDGDVHCLVRAGDTEHAMRRISDNLRAYRIDPEPYLSRIVPIAGDLARPRLGLSDTAFAGLHDTIGDIVHCGGMVKWTYPYQGLADANVGGTQEILRLATGGAPRPVHFISTVGVFSAETYPGDEVDEHADMHTSGPLTVGYAQSKWVAERMIRFAAERGVPTTIHRINTGGHSRTGAYNRVDHLTMIVKGCVETAMAPDDLVDMPVQPAPIDYVAAAVAEATRHPELFGETLHLVNRIGMDWRRFFDCVEEYGYPLERVTREEWRTQVTGRGASTMALLGLAPFLHDSLEHVRLPFFESGHTRALLAGTGLECPDLDAGLVGVFLDGFVEGGLIKRPVR